MRFLKTLLPLLTFHAAAFAGPIIALTDFSDPSTYGTLDLVTGIFTQTGTTDVGELVNGPGGAVFGFKENGDLVRVSGNGATSFIGSSGLTLDEPARLLDGTIYTTDLAHNLYTVNPSTGAATLVGPTGFVDPVGGLFNVILLAGQTNTLYAIATSLDSSLNVIDHAQLFRINRATGARTFVANVANDAITCGLFVDGKQYLFDFFSQVSLLNLTTGNVTQLYDLSSSLEGIHGVAAVPEPATWAMMALAGAMMLCLRRKLSRA